MTKLEQKLIELEYVKSNDLENVWLKYQNCRIFIKLEEDRTKIKYKFYDNEKAKKQLEQDLKVLEALCENEE
jgi:hypothetical protein